jgi:hypothetical protein
MYDMFLFVYVGVTQPGFSDLSRPFNTQTPGKYPEDNLSLQQQGESLKTRICYSCQILMELEFYRQFFFEKYVSNCMKIRPVGAELFHADGRTD